MERSKDGFFRLFLFLSFLILLMPDQVSADAGVTYHGRLLKPDGAPVRSSSVQFLLQIRTPSPASCLMYEETHVKDLSQTNGVFSITINDGSQIALNTEPFDLETVFQNGGNTVVFPVGKCSGSSSVTFVSTLSRQLWVYFNDGSFTGWEPLPPQSINFVPMALESVSLEGHRPSNFFRVVDSGALQTMSPWSSANYQKLLDLIGDTTISGGNASIGGNAAGFTGVLAGDVTGGQSSTKVEKIQGRSVFDSNPVNGQVLTWNHAQLRWEPANVPVAGNPDWSDITNRPTSLPPSGVASGDLTGNYPGPTIAPNAVSGAKIADGGVAFSKISAGSATGQVFQYDTSLGWQAEKLLYTDLVKAGGGSPWPSTPCVAGEAIIWQSATDGFECAPISITEADPTVKGFAKNDPSSDFSTTGNVLTLNTVPITRGGTGAVSQSGAINNLLPSQGGNSGKLLQTNGTNVSWVDAPASGVTSINGATGASQTFNTAQANTAPTFTRVGDTHTLEIPLASTSGVTAGTISYTDYQAFSGKQNALGFTPLNPANNLSELSSAATARTNLGLGTAATKNFGTSNGNLVELDGSGKIPSSLLPSQSGTYFAQGGNAFSAPAVLGTTDTQPLYLRTGGTDKMTVLNNGNVGIGTASPKAALEIRGSSQSSLTGVVYAAHDVAQWDSNSASSTGTMVITLPQLWTSTMMRITIHGYNYWAGAWEVVVGGYNYNAGSWIATSAEISGKAPFSKVRVGSDGTKNVILLGDLTTAISYLQVNISEVTLSRGNAGQWATGWNISQVTDESPYLGLTNVPVTSWQTGSANSTYYASGNVGIGTTTPNDKLDVAGRIRATHICATDGTNCKDLTSSWGGGGTVTSVTSANADISVATGTTTPILTLNSGTGASQILKLNASSQIPAVSGALLTDLNASNLTTGTVNVARLGSGTADTTTFLRGDGTWASVPASGLTSLNGLTGGTQTFATPGTTGSAPSWVSSGSTHTLHIPMAATAGVTAGLISKTQYDALNAKQAAGNYMTALTGDVTAAGPGSAAATIANNAVTSAKIATDAVTSAKILDGTINAVDLDFAGTNGATSSFVLKDSTGKFANFACSTTGHVPTWTATGFVCQAPSITETDPKVGANTTDALSKWDGTKLVASGVYESGGNVGIGTATPATNLDVNGTASVNASQEGVSGFVNSSTAYAIPDTTFNIRRITLTGNTTITLPTSTTPSGKVWTLTVFVKQDATGARTLAWAAPSGDQIKWDQAITPSHATVANKVTIYQFVKPYDDTVWYGSMIWREN